MVPRGARLAARIARAGALLVPARHGSGRRAAAERLAVDLRRLRAGRGPRTRTASRASGTSTCSRPSSPTSTGRIPDVWAEHEDILRFWFDRGVAGVRIDSAALLVKDPELAEEHSDSAPGEHPFTGPGPAARDLPPLARDRRRLSRAARARRRGLAARRRAASRATSGRTSCTPPSTSTSSRARGSRARCARRSTSALAAHAPVDAPATWVLSNHDVTRPVTRYGRADTVVRVRVEAGGHADRPGARHAARPGRRAAGDGAARLDVRLPGRGARPARRSRTSRSSAARIRCGSAPAASIPVATAAGSRCPGPATQPPYGFSADGGRPTLARPARRLGAR